MLVVAFFFFEKERMKHISFTDRNFITFGHFRQVIIFSIFKASTNNTVDLKCSIKEFSLKMPFFVYIIIAFYDNESKQSFFPKLYSIAKFSSMHIFRVNEWISAFADLSVGCK